MVVKLLHVYVQEAISADFLNEMKKHFKKRGKTVAIISEKEGDILKVTSELDPFDLIKIGFWIGTFATRLDQKPTSVSLN